MLWGPREPAGRSGKNGSYDIYFPKLLAFFRRKRPPRWVGTKCSPGTCANCRTKRWRRFPMKRFFQAGCIAVALAASATAAFAMPRVPASAIAAEVIIMDGAEDAAIIVTITDAPAGEHFSVISCAIGVTAGLCNSASRART